MPELEAQLRALADDVVWPATPDLAAAVARAPRAPRRRRPPRPPRARRRGWPRCCSCPPRPSRSPARATTCSSGSACATSRSAACRRPPADARPELEADLGRRVTLAQARARGRLHARRSRPALGAPDRVRVTGQRISLDLRAAARPAGARGGRRRARSSPSRAAGSRASTCASCCYGGTDVERVRVRGAPRRLHLRRRARLPLRDPVGHRSRRTARCSPDRPWSGPPAAASTASRPRRRAPRRCASRAPSSRKGGAPPA